MTDLKANIDETSSLILLAEAEVGLREVLSGNCVSNEALLKVLGDSSADTSRDHRIGGER